MSLLEKYTGGFPCGEARDLKPEELNIASLLKTRNYFIKVKVLRYRKETSFPILCHKGSGKGGESESLKYTFQIPEEGVVAHLNNISFEDLVKYHELCEEDVEILGGHIFDKEEPNPNVSILNRYVYKLRSLLKEEGCPLQTVLKLFLNSGYGKLLQKKYATITKVVKFYNEQHLAKVLSEDVERLQKFTYNTNFSHIFMDLEKSSIHFNHVHLASLILAASKRVMYIVSEIIERVGGKVLYTDTDSLFIQQKYINEISSIFEEEQGLPLYGPSLGQFHSDIEIDGKEDPTAYISDLCVVGPKLKCAIVRYMRDGEEKTTYQITSKGVAPAVILKHCETQGITPFEFFIKLYKDETIECDMLSTGKPSFIHTDKQEIFSNLFFTRKLKASYQGFEEYDGLLT
jgi:hypothetical protein